MTCIVGTISNDGRVVIGADSIGVSGYDITNRKDAKVFRVGSYLIGFTTSFRMGQLLRYRLEVPEQDEGIDDFRHMATTFVDAVRKCLEDGGFQKTNSDQVEGGCFLVGYRGHLYYIGSDYQVGESTDRYDAVGSGAEYAKGAMRAMAQSGIHQMWNTVDVVRSALEAAAHFCTYVGGPFVIEGDT